jgi:hypothetical protein
MISFEYECWDPYGDIDVVAEDDGTGLLIFVHDTNIPIDLSELRASDQSRVKALLKEWVDHYRDMDERPPSHPANDAFGPAYIRGLNQDMGK